MLCSKCGTQNEQNSKFCVGCGNIIETTNLFDNQELNNNINNQQTNNYNISQEYEKDIDEELIQAYIGKNEKKIRRKGGTILPILVGPAYYFYRKLYIEGVIWIGIIIIVELFLENYALSIYSFSAIIAGFIFRILYLNKVNKDISKIKKENLHKSIDDLKNICSKKGGTNELVVFIVIIFYGGLMYLESNQIGTDTVICKNINNEKITMKINSKGEYVNTINLIYEADNEYALSIMYSLMKSEYPNEKIEQNGLSLNINFDMKNKKVNKKEYISNSEQKGYVCQK